MTLNDWINERGVDKVAELVGVHVSTVRHWRNGHCHPRIDQMKTIKKVSGGLVGYEQIIENPTNEWNDRGQP